MLMIVMMTITKRQVSDGVDEDDGGGQERTL